MRTTAELREGYLSFFEERGHLRCPSYSLVPRAGDDSTLLTAAGMQPQMPFFLGREAPQAPLTTLSQKPLQANFEQMMQNPKAIRGAMQSLTRKSGPGLDTQFEATRQGLLGSPLEAMLMTPGQLQAAGLDPKMPVGLWCRIVMWTPTKSGGPPKRSLRVVGHQS